MCLVIRFINIYISGSGEGEGEEMCFFLRDVCVIFVYVLLVGIELFDYSWL